MEVRTMPRSQFRRLGEMVGMYAYLAAIGGLRYWPAARRAGIEEETWPVQAEMAPHAEEFFSDSVRDEYSSSRERTPVN
jgi:hypothetical protein